MAIKHIKTSIYFSIILLVLTITLSCNKVEKQNSNHQIIPENIEAEKTAVKNTLIKMWTAIETEDIDTYASYIHPDFSQFGEYDSILKIGKDIEVKGVANWVKDSDNIHTEMIEPKVTINGNVAWITYYWV